MVFAFALAFALVFSFAKGLVSGFPTVVLDVLAEGRSGTGVELLASLSRTAAALGGL